MQSNTASSNEGNKMQKDIKLETKVPNGTIVTYTDGTIDSFRVHKLWGRPINTFREKAAVCLVQDEDTYEALGVDKLEDLPEVERYCRATGMQGEIQHLTLKPI